MEFSRPVLLSSAYLAPISYYALLYRAEQVWVEAWEHYHKQSYRNRCHILTANGVMPLSIPVEKGSGKIGIRDVRIADHAAWQHVHWTALVSAYNATPYFEYYADDFRPFYEGFKSSFLFDYNEQLQALICSLIDFSPRQIQTPNYQEEVSEGICDLRDSIHPKRPLWDGIPLAVPYYQQFTQKQGFVPNLSIVDLLFNMGPESLLVLQRMCAAEK